MLALELRERLLPPRGCLLVCRDERPAVARGLWLPARARSASRAAVATVERVASDVRELCPGDRVLLAATVGARQIHLGERGELRLEVCKPSQILALILDDDVAVEHRGEHPLSHLNPAALATEPEPFDEGDPLAIR